MLLIGVVMLLANLASALTATSYDASWSWYAALAGLGIVLFALADMLVGRGIKWAVVALRIVALLGFSAILVRATLEAIGGDNAAVFGLIVGLATFALIYAIKKARGAGHQS